MTRRTILGIFAHPDDESMGPGGTLARYAAEGHRVAFITATAGGAGRYYEARPEDNRQLMAARRRETEEAAQILGIESLGFLEWIDGQLDRMNILDVEHELVTIIRRERPDVLITFHGSGISYHADHRVLALALTGAFLGAAHRDWYVDERVAALAPHRPSKLYHYVPSRAALAAVNWPRTLYAAHDDEITTVIDTRAMQETRWKAIQVHATQQYGPPFQTLYDAGAFAREAFVRVLPSPSPGEGIETDLLAGLPPGDRGGHTRS